jgi:hypothetical protein
VSARAALTGWEDRVEPWRPRGVPRLGLLLAWQAGRAPFVRVQGVDVLRIGDGLAGDVFAVLAERGIPHGPALINIPRRCVEVFVPVGSAAVWRPQPQTVCVAHALMRCPAPTVTRASGSWAAGRTWTTPPGTDPEATSADVLATVLPEALARRGAALAGRIEGWGGKRPRPGHPREGQQL